jgi:predicted nucleotidyltransferase
MNAIVESKLGDVAELCRRHHVRRLDLFGSATSDRFDPTRSDLDFLVEFEMMPPGEYANSFFDLLLELEQLFNRHIDLVTGSSIENPYFRASVERSRQPLYAA